MPVWDTGPNVCAVVPAPDDLIELLNYPLVPSGRVKLAYTDEPFASVEEPTNRNF